MCHIFASILGLKVDDVTNPSVETSKKGESDETEGKTERVTHILPNRNLQKWKKVTPFTKIFLRSLIHFCSNLPAYPDMVMYVLRRMEKYIPYVATDIKMSQRLLKVRGHTHTRTRINTHA